jgi:hypothetical protein
MEFVACIGGRKLLGDRTALTIACQFHLIDAGTQLSHALHPARQASPLENAHLDFGHVQPICSISWNFTFSQLMKNSVTLIKNDYCLYYRDNNHYI